MIFINIMLFLNAHAVLDFIKNNMFEIYLILIIYFEDHVLEIY